ncbi:venom metalloproteinase BumaMPs1-like [Amblyomma americanum]
MPFVAFFLRTLLVAVAPTATEDETDFHERGVTVYPRVLEDRQESSEKVLIIHDGYHLNLKKASILAARLLLRDVTDEGVAERYVDGGYYERHLYKDASKHASLMLKPQGSDYIVTGLVNLTHRIEPVVNSERSSTTPALHKVIKIQNSAGICEDEPLIEKDLPEEAGAPKVETREAIPDSIGVELHFISDYNHTMHFENSTEDRIAYVTLFMNSVSLRLDQLKPQVPIGLTTIQGTFQENEPYVELWTNGDLIGNETLKKLNEVVKNDSSYKKADAVYLATAREMISLIPGGKSSYIAGTAGQSRACSDERGAVGEDKPDKFTGVSTAAHEIGHLLGAPDDGYESAGKCSTGDGYVMSKYTRGKHEYSFSECSKEAIAEFLTRNDSSCLKESNTSCHIVSLPNKAVKLPGYVMDGDTFCKQFYRGFESAYYLELYHFLSKCRISCLVVEKRTKKLRLETTFAVDGMRCSKDNPFKRCKNAICV